MARRQALRSIAFVARLATSRDFAPAGIASRASLFASDRAETIDKTWKGQEDLLMLTSSSHGRGQPPFSV